MSSNNGIVVVGSCMMDFVCYAPRLPKNGETIHGSKFATNFGGKGANQCVAGAKLGGKTTLIARVGDDIWGDKYINNLKDHHVDVTYMQKTEGFSTGIAQITVSDKGENQIVIVGGANASLSIQDVQNAENFIANASVVVCQLEISLNTAMNALKACKGISILNGAPAISEFPEELLTLPTIFCVNESEAEVFSGLKINDIRDGKLAVNHLLDKGCQSVLLTFGSKGALYKKQGDVDVTMVSCPQVKCVDSTGAGDSFIGALAFMLDNRKDFDMKKCIEAACFIASDSVKRLGTQISFPGPEILTNI